MSALTFQVRQLPLPRCKAHNAIGKWNVDGTDEWWCRDCMAIANRAAEVVLGPERRQHAYHTRVLRSCPFCNPGMVA